MKLVVSLKNDIAPNENDSAILNIAYMNNLRHVVSHFNMRDSKRWTWRHPRYRSGAVLASHMRFITRCFTGVFWPLVTSCMWTVLQTKDWTCALCTSPKSRRHSRLTLHHHPMTLTHPHCNQKSLHHLLCELSLLFLLRNSSQWNPRLNSLKSLPLKQSN